MSSLLDVPAQLALVLSLAASTVANEPPRTPVAVETVASSSQAALVPQPLEGPLRFSEGMWLKALKEGLMENDAPGYAGDIFRTSGGRYYVPAATERRRILEARSDAALASRVARAFAESNARQMSAALRRAPTAGDLYIAHIFGPEAATSFIMLVGTKPAEAAARHLPELAQAAPALLYARGTSLTLAQIYKRLTDPLRQRSPELAAVESASDTSHDAMLTLKPTVADAVQSATTSRASRPEGVVWQAEVSVARSGAPIQ